MKKATVLVDFAKFPMSNKLEFYGSVLLCLTDNPYFTNPDIPLAEVQLSLDELLAAKLASHDGSSLCIAIMHEKDLMTEKKFRILVAYVNRMADGDVSKIISSGFNVSKQHIMINKAILAIKYGVHSGTVILVAKTVDNAAAYIWQMYVGEFAPLTDAEWITIGHSTNATFEVTGLTKTTVCHFRYSAITAKGTTDFCASVGKIIL